MYFSNFDKDQTFIFVCRIDTQYSINDVAQLSLYKHDNFCQCFEHFVFCALCFHRVTKTPKPAKICNCD